MRTLEKVFYLVLFLVTCFIQFGMAQIQDTIGKYVNTRPLEQHTLKDGRILVILDDLWKNTQLVPFENKQRFLLRKGSVALPIAFELPDTVNSWVIDVYFTKYVATQPPPQIVLKETINDRDPRIKYSAGWNESGAGASWASKFNNGDVKFTYQVGATATFDFTGKKISVIAEECDNHSNVKIEILQGSAVVKTASVNTYRSTGTAAMPASNTNQCPAGVKTVIYTSDVLPQGNYTARVTLENVNLTTVPQRNSFVFDGFLVYE